MSKLMPGLAQEGTEIIIIDNDSRDGTVNYLSWYDCLLKINKVKMNFSQSNNYGASKASGEYLLFLNNDTIISPNFAEEMLKTFSIDPRIGIVGCQIRTMEVTPRIQHAGVMFTTDYVPYELGLPQPDISPGLLRNDDRVGSVREVPAVTACCMMVRKSVFEELGGFDEEYLNGWEDIDFVLRAREKGYKAWYTGKTFIKHLKFGSRTAGRFKYEKENRQRYDDIWVHTKRAKEVLNDFREG